MITISAFKWVPDFAQGQVRDLRARWALEEAGLPLQDAPSRPGRSGQAGLSRPAALRPGADPRGGRLRALRIGSHRALRRRAQRDAAAEGAAGSRPRDAMADRRAQLHRAVRHGCGPDRYLLRGSGMGQAAARRARWSSCSRRLAGPLQGARRQALSRRRPLHGGRPDDDARCSESSSTPTSSPATSALPPISSAAPPGRPSSARSMRRSPTSSWPHERGVQPMPRVILTGSIRQHAGGHGEPSVGGDTAARGGERARGIASRPARLGGGRAGRAAPPCQAVPRGACVALDAPLGAR